MALKLLHIYRNTPFGRETLLQSIYFSRRLVVPLDVYVPKEKKFLMYFQHEAVELDLDESYTQYHSSAHERLQTILEQENAKAQIVDPSQYTASNLPDLPTNFGFMTCPRVISERMNKMSLTSMGKGVRSVLKAAHFPVLIPTPVFKPWQSVAVLFGGSVNGFKALHLGLRVARDSQLPLDVFTQGKAGTREELEKLLAENGLAHDMQNFVRRWEVFEKGDLAENLMELPHDCLIVLGAYGHGLINDVKEALFGSVMELVQSTMPNNLLVVGPYFMRDNPELARKPGGGE